MARVKFSRLLAAAGPAALLFVAYAACVAQAQTIGKTSDQKEATEFATLAKARLDAARQIYDGTMKATREVISSGGVLTPVAKPEEAYTWSVRWLNAQRDMANGKEDQVAALQDHLGRMKKLQECVSGNLWSPAQHLATRYYVAEAEFWLAQEKAKQKAKEQAQAKS